MVREAAANPAVSATVVSMRLNPVLEALAPDPISLVRARVRRLQAAGRKAIDFTVGDPREPTPSFIPATLRSGIAEVSQYPLTTGRTELRIAIAEYIQRRFGVRVDPETEVIPTSGSKEAIFSTPNVFVDPAGDDVVVYPSPSYPVYEWGARFAGATPAPVVCSGDFVMRAADIDQATWNRAKIVWSCSPHNPTGSVTGVDDYRELIDRCREVDAMFFADECYVDLYEDAVYPQGPPSALQVAGDGLRNVVVFLSLSKRSGMTGYRCGVVVGDAAAIEAIVKFRRSTGTASPDFVQLAGAAAWADDDHVAKRRKIFSDKRIVISKAFADAGFPTVASEAGLYLWVNVADDLAVSDRLLEAGVVVTPGRFFGAGGEGHIRVALVPTLDECRSAVEVISQCLSQ